MRWLLLLLIAAPAHAGLYDLSTPAPFGEVRGWSVLEYREDVAALSALAGDKMVSYQRVNAAPDLAWMSFALFHSDSLLAWPNGEIRLMVKGEEVRPVRMLLCGAPPRLHPFSLTGRAAQFDPGTLWRKRFPKGGGLASVVFVAYPHGTDVRNASQVRLAVPSQAGGPHTSGH